MFSNNVLSQREVEFTLAEGVQMKPYNLRFWVQMAAVAALFCGCSSSSGTEPTASGADGSDSGTSRSYEDVSATRDSGQSPATSTEDAAGLGAGNTDASVVDESPQVDVVDSAEHDSSTGSELVGLDVCEQYEGQAIPASTVYWVGEFVLAGDSVSGTETWLHYANQAWRDTGADDCSVIWTGRGTIGDVVGCSTCSYSLQLSFTADLVNSSCPEGLTPADSMDEDYSYDVTYDVLAEGSGAVRFYYPGSGNLLGEGTLQGDRLNYVTAGRCAYF